MSLTPKQQAEKLSALRSMALHTGLIASHTALAVSEAELARRFEQFGAEFVAACVAVILDDEAQPIRKSASGLLLECFIPNWRELVGPELVGQVVEREDAEVRAWRAAVLERDGHKCTKCGSTDNLHAHHIVRWVDAPALRIVVDNGITLCQPCHGAVHAKA